jgi:hypothetical protein
MQEQKHILETKRYQQTDTIVIGAGLSGLIVAQQLHASGQRVICVDKARGTGGRLSSKRIETASAEMVAFDLGCTSFNALSFSFQRQVREWIDEGVIAEVPATKVATPEKRYIGTPRSSSLTRHLSSGLDIRFGTRVSHLEREEGRWVVYVDSSAGKPATSMFICDRVVLAIPPSQAAAMLPADHSLKASLASVNMVPQWVVVLVTSANFSLATQREMPDSALIARCSLENSKPGRDSGFTGNIYQLQATSAWTNQHIDAAKEDVIAMFTEEFKRCVGSDIDVVASYAHRWLYSQRSGEVVARQDFLARDDGINVCGDYMCNDPRFEGVEAAYISAIALAEKMLHACTVAY